MECINTKGDFQLLDLTSVNLGMRNKNRIYCIAYKNNEIMLMWRRGKAVYTRSLMNAPILSLDNTPNMTILYGEAYDLLMETGKKK